MFYNIKNTFKEYSNENYTCSEWRDFTEVYYNQENSIIAFMKLGMFFFV